MDRNCPVNRSFRKPVMEISTDFDQRGYLDPVSILSPRECRQLVRHVRSSEFKPPVDWYKGLAVSDPVIRRLGRDERICAIARQCLGSDIVLWGANIIRRKPGQPHPWHSDIESSSPAGGFVSVWVGLKNVSWRTSFSVIAGSQLTGQTVQETRYAHNSSRDEVNAADALRWARARNPDCGLVTLKMRAGSAMFFDGRLWHSTVDSGFFGKRWALLLQYARRGAEYRIFDSDKLDWPISWQPDHTPQLVEIDAG